MHYDIPQTKMQQAIFFESLKNPRSNIYNVQSIYTLDAKADCDKLVETAKLMIKKHPIFRTSFYINDNGECVQRINDIKEVQPKYNIVDFSKSTEQNNLFQEYLKDDRAQNINFQSKSLIRGTIVLLAEETKLIFTYHHILLDGWSAGIAQNDFFDIYDYLKQGKVINIREDRTFENYCNNYGNNYESNSESTLSYWKKQLETYNPVSTSNIGTIEGTVKTNQNSIYLSAELSKKIQKFARENKLTLSSVMLAGYIKTLAKLKNIDDYCVGVVNSGRFIDLDNIENAVGCMMSIIPIRLKNLNKGTFLKLCKTVQNLVMAGSFEYEYSYDMNKLIFENKEGQYKLFDDLFLFENYPVKQKHRENIVIKNHEANDTNSYPLVSYFYNDKNKGKIEIEFQRSTAYLTNLEDTLTETFATSIDYFAGKREKLTEQIIDSLEKHSNEIAINYKGSDFTYNFLKRNISVLANYISSSIHGKFVGVFMDSSVDSMIAILAIILSGKAYVPIDPNMPRSRINYIIKDSDIDVLLTNSDDIDSKSGSIHKNRINIKNIISEKAYSDRLSDINVNNYTNEAYIIYTSGSTGNPKGVVISRNNLLGFLKWNKEKLDYKESDVILQNHSLSFDNSIWEIFSALLSGGKLVIPEDRRNIEEVIKLIQEQKVTSLSVTPSQLGVLLEYVEFLDNNALQSLTRLFVGSERVPYQVIEKAFSFLSLNCHVFNEYGPTETTITSSMFEIKRKELDKYGKEASIPIGKPIAGCDFYLLPKNTQEPIVLKNLLEIGELYIGGPRVGQGYYKNESKTTESFLNINGQRIYKTGDLVKRDSKGLYTFIGRTDDQVKIRGYRVEIGEVEAAIRRIKGIDEVAVIVLDDNNIMTSSIIAFYVSHTHVSASYIRTALLKELPDYMVPSNFNEIEKMPLNSSGKINKKVLKANYSSESSTDDYMTENIIIKAIREVLQMNEVDTTKNFVQLGGDSIKCAKVVAILQKASCDLSFADIFNAPSIDYLINKKERKNITKNSFSQFIPLNYTQNEILVDTLEYTGEKDVYIQANLFETSVSYANKIIKKCILYLVERHPNVFGFVEMKEEQFGIHSLTPDEFLEKGVKITEKDSEFDADFKQNQKYNLFGDPLIHFEFLRNENGLKVAIIFHQLVLDGISFNNLINELFYGLDLLNRNETLDEMPISIDSVIIEKNKKSKEEFVEKIEEPPLFTKKLDYISNTDEIDISKEEFAQLKRILDRHGITLNSFMFYIFSKIIYLMSSVSDFEIGFAIDGRDPGIKNVYSAIGNFIQTIIYKNTDSFSKDIDITEVKSVSNKLNSLYEKSHKYNFRQEVKNYKTARLDAMYSYHGYNFNEYFKPSVVRELKSIDALPYVISVAVVPNEEEQLIKMVFDYDSSLNSEFKYAKKIVHEEINNFLAIKEPKDPNSSQLYIQLRDILENITKKAYTKGTSFEAMGFNSLLLAVLYRKLIEKGFNVSFKDILSSNNIEELSKKLSSEESLEVSSESSESRFSPNIAIPISNIQKRILFSMIKDGKLNNNAMYCQQSIYRIKEDIDFEKLNNGVKQLVKRHPTLRSTIDTEKFLQIFDNKRTDLPVSMISVESEQQKQKVLKEMIQKVANPQSRWLFNIVLMHNEQSKLLVLTYNHLILDGLSENIILNELINYIYGGKSITGVNEEYQEWLQKLTSNTQDHNYTDNTIVPPNKIGHALEFESFDRKNKKITKEINDEFYTKLQNKSKSENISVSDILLSAFFRSINSETHTQFDAIDIVLANPRFEALVGCTIQSVPLIVPNYLDEISMLQYIHNKIKELRIANIGDIPETSENVKSNILYSYESDYSFNTIEDNNDRIYSVSFEEKTDYGLSINVIDEGKNLSITFIYRNECENEVKEIIAGFYSNLYSICDKEPNKSSIEEIVKNAWEDALGNKLNIEDLESKTFFDLGGNSLGLFNLSKIFREKWDININIQELLLNLEFNKLVECIKKKVN